MGYAGKINQRSLAIKLRFEGVSVREIQRRLNVSRSSVSLWVREVNLTDDQKQRLYGNARTGRLSGAIIAAENKRTRRIEQEAMLHNLGKKEFGRLSSRDFFVSGVALYFAEGDKKGAGVAFSNSDPRSIKFMADWFRKFLNFPEDKFRGYIYIHDNQDIEAARSFWSKLTKIPLSQFRKIYVVPNNKNRLRKVQHPHGVFRISISDVRALRKIKGWIAGLLGDRVDSN